MNIYRTAAGEYLVAGKEHSWGGFPSRREAQAFCKQVEAENAAYHLRWTERELLRQKERKG